MLSTSIAGLRVQLTPLSGLLILQPRVFEDERGYFLESYNERDIAGTGIQERFVQDNHSYSVRNVVRGLHYQIRHQQGKLVRVIQGEILDVAVDLRISSPTFGKWHAVTLSDQNKRISGCRRVSHMASECFPVGLMCSTRRPTSTVPNMNEQSAGTIHI